MLKWKQLSGEEEQHFMGLYLNTGNEGFRSARKGLYVDKSGLISLINDTLGTSDKLTCVSRPRRFGKSFVAKMLCAYYDKSCDSRSLFCDLEIAKDPSFEKHLNQYDVICLDITWFISLAKTTLSPLPCGHQERNSGIRHTVSYLQQEVIQELSLAYPSIGQPHSLPLALAKVSEITGHKFIVIIDEWDALFREAKEDSELQEEYLQLLRGLFKSVYTDKTIEASYMTGILPIKKYGTQSALTDFREYTMIHPQMLAEYTGFTEDEVQNLCKNYDLYFEEAKKWYDGYSLGHIKSVYNPNSIIRAIKNGEFSNYWTETETYESLKLYIGMNYDGLKDAIISMLGNIRCKINTRTFQNDLSSIKSKDDVMTLLIHLGYLGYDFSKNEVYIPNQEIADEFKNAIEYSGWEGISAALHASEDLLEATIHGQTKLVETALDQVHMSNTSVLSYHDENSLSCAITIAYYMAQKDYTLIRELPTGKGFADIAFIPRRHTHKPAMIVELKWNKSAQGAIRQIKEKKYIGTLEEYMGNLLLVGINYDKKTKKHKCIIEKYNTIFPER